MTKINNNKNSPSLLPFDSVHSGKPCPEDRKSWVKSPRRVAQRNCLCRSKSPALADRNPQPATGRGVPCTWESSDMQRIASSSVSVPQSAVRGQSAEPCAPAREGERLST